MNLSWDYPSSGSGGHSGSKTYTIDGFNSSQPRLKPVEQSKILNLEEIERVEYELYSRAKRIGMPSSFAVYASHANELIQQLIAELRKERKARFTDVSVEALKSLQANGDVYGKQ